MPSWTHQGPFGHHDFPEDDPFFERPRHGPPHDHDWDDDFPPPPPPPPPPPHHHRGPRHRPGPDFPPGFPPGPRGFGPRGFAQRGRLFGPGDLRLLILSLIGEQPRHGYEIIKAVEEKLQGTYSPSPGAVYPILAYLQDQDYIVENVEARGKRLYSITETGRALVEENRVYIEGLLTRLGITAEAMSQERPPEQVFQALHTLHHALLLHRARWSDVETNRVCKILYQATRDVNP